MFIVTCSFLSEICRVLNAVRDFWIWGIHASFLILLGNQDWDLRTHVRVKSALAFVGHPGLSSGSYQLTSWASRQQWSSALQLVLCEENEPPQASARISRTHVTPNNMGNHMYRLCLQPELTVSLKQQCRWTLRWATDLLSFPQQLCPPIKCKIHETKQAFSLF